MEFTTYADNLAHLQGELLVLNLRLHRQVLRWRATHHSNATPEELLGLHISDLEVDAILDGLYAANAGPASDPLDKAPIATLSRLLQEAEEHHRGGEDNALAEGVRPRLPELAERLELSAFERNVILLAVAPELDRRYERLFGYLNDDVTRRLPTVDLALGLYGGGPEERAGLRQSFSASRRLRDYRLLHVEASSENWRSGLLSATLKIDESVVAYLLGQDQPDEQLHGLARLYLGGPGEAIVNAGPGPDLASLENYLKSDPPAAPVICVSGPDTEHQLAAASRLAQAPPAGAALLVLDGKSVSTRGDAEDLIARALRQTRLGKTALVVKEANTLAGTAALSRLIDSARENPLFLLTREPWKVAPAAGPALSLSLPALEYEDRKLVWSGSLNGYTSEEEVSDLADRFRLTSGQIADAVHQAQVNALAFGGEPGRPNRSDLINSCRAQTSDALKGLAQPIESIHSWNDLILPANVKNQLLSLEHWVRYRHVVYGDWGFSQRVMQGKGLVVLFSGASGTGKTMAVGILARNLELDLYRIDLSTVVSKYIGETEKNLSQIFEAAESANAILFFDEADALFGKRSEVKDAHDRYANIEVSYLLQRMESYDGVAILATNFRQNLDNAFARRMHAVVELPLPGAGDRERIWRQLLPPSVPQSPDIDLSYVSRQFALTGGNIKNCVITAAFAAASEGGPIAMLHLVQAVARELNKIERPIVRSDFGDYYDLIRV